MVEQFLHGLPDGSIGLDVGCGNGKYLDVNSKVFIIASDRSVDHLNAVCFIQIATLTKLDSSANLVKIASSHHLQTSIVADNLALPHPCSSFDFAISIAVIHHLSTRDRRIEALSAILETLQPVDQVGNNEYNGGRALIFVWALEQKSSRRGWDEGDKQDVMVPWVMNQKSDREAGKSPRIFHRYYHLYRHGELEGDVTQARGIIEASGYEKDNWWVIARRKSTLTPKSGNNSL